MSTWPVHVGACVACTPPHKGFEVAGPGLPSGSGARLEGSDFLQAAGGKTLLPWGEAILSCCRGVRERFCEEGELLDPSVLCGSKRETLVIVYV